MIFNQYPYLNLNDLNLDFILKSIGEMEYEVTNFVSINAIKYADPIQWDITRQYEKNTIVIDPLTGTAYISVAAVPSGVALTRPEYWTVVFDLEQFVVRAAKNFTNHYEEATTLTATFNTSAGGWLVWGDVLYIADTNITAGDAYVVGGNIHHFTMEAVINDLYYKQGDLDTLTTTNKTDLVDAINEVNGNVGDLNALTTTNKNSAVEAIDEVNGNVGDLNALTTTNKNSAVEAIDEVNAKVNAMLDVKLVCIGDSWLNAGGWGDRLAVDMGASAHHIYQSNGAGFARTGYTTFHELLESAIADLTAAQRAEITHVVIGGGINDQWDVEADLYTAAVSMFADTVAAFPNAKVYYFANQGNGVFSSDYYSRITNIQNRASDNGVIVLEHVTYCMMGAGTFYMTNDYVHPTTNGYYLIASCIFENMHGNDVDYIANIGSKYNTSVVKSTITRKDNIITLNIKFTPAAAGDISEGLYCGLAPIGLQATSQQVWVQPTTKTSDGSQAGVLTITTNGIQAWGMSSLNETC